MKRKIVLLLIAHILLCVAGMGVAGFGFLELMDKGIALSDEVARIPMAISMILSGIFTFVSVFTNGVDNNYWKSLD